ncbi:hypothetical protein DFH06DRAFT_1143510 [Mycena polygramma]|nr:hypothetical protein DFH06DRAFT_1143510 [Mycena polygramma]
MNRAFNNSVSSSLNQATISMDDFRNDVESRIRRLRGIATQTDVPAKNGGLSHEDFKMAVVSKILIPAKTNVKLEGAPGIPQPTEEAVAEAGVHNVLGLTIEPVKPVSGSKRKRDNMSPPQSVVTKTGGNPRIVVANVENPAIIVVAAPKTGQATAEMTTAAQFAQTKTNLMRVPQRSLPMPANLTSTSGIGGLRITIAEFYLCHRNHPRQDCGAVQITTTQGCELVHETWGLRRGYVTVLVLSDIAPCQSIRKKIGNKAHATAIRIDSLSLHTLNSLSSPGAVLPRTPSGPLRGDLHAAEACGCELGEECSRLALSIARVLQDIP